MVWIDNFALAFLKTYFREREFNDYGLALLQRAQGENNLSVLGAFFDRRVVEEMPLRMKFVYQVLFKSLFPRVSKRIESHRGLLDALEGKT